MEFTALGMQDKEDLMLQFLLDMARIEILRRMKKQHTIP